jgi:predicted RNA binding protein YcfA (HicA-like mRNA interferase family)
MSSISKVLSAEQVTGISGPGLRLAPIRRALRAEGWVTIRQAGSHETWEREDGTKAVTVAGKDSDTGPAGTLAVIRRTTGLEHLR